MTKRLTKDEKIARKEARDKTRMDEQQDKLETLKAEAQAGDAIAGPPTGAVTSSEALPGEDEGEVAFATHPAMHVVELAKSLFRNINKARGSNRVMAGLNDPQKKTLLGAHTVTGQLLGKNGSRGPLTINHFVQDLTMIDHALFTIRPVLPQEEISDEDMAVELPVSPEAVDNTMDIELLGIPQELSVRASRMERPEAVAWLIDVYEHIRNIRASVVWHKKLFAFHHRYLQGVQITAAQLLGLSDSHGAITLQRYMKAAIGDARVMNALGYYRVPGAGRIK